MINIEKEKTALLKQRATIQRENMLGWTSVADFDLQSRQLDMLEEYVIALLTRIQYDQEGIVPPLFKNPPEVGKIYEFSNNFQFTAGCISRYASTTQYGAFVDENGGIYDYCRPVDPEQQSFGI